MRKTFLVTADVPETCDVDDIALHLTDEDAREHSGIELHDVKDVQDPEDVIAITFAGEAYESFQNAVDNLPGYVVRITPRTLFGPGDAAPELTPFDAILTGANRGAEWGDTVLFTRADEQGFPIEGAVTESMRVAAIHAY